MLDRVCTYHTSFQFMSSSEISSTKPYLLRAIFDWAEDNGFTPQVLVNALAQGVEVPQAHVVDGQIVLNISSSAVQLHVMDNDCLSFSARFSGIEQDIFLPIDSIMAIFARENSQGIFFEEYEGGDENKRSASTEPNLKSVEGDDAENQSSTKPKGSSKTSQSKSSAKTSGPKSTTKKKTKKPAKRDSSHLKIIK